MATCFQLLCQTLEGYANLLNRKIQAHSAAAQYQLHSCIFNSSTKQFIGRFHDSRPCDLIGTLRKKAVVCPIQQVLFFHTDPSADPSLLLVVELTASYSTGGEQQCIVLGWVMLQLCDIGSHVRGGARGGAKNSIRLPLYEGSARALFCTDHPSHDTPGITPVSGCLLSLSLSPHLTLSRSLHLIPANTLVSCDDNIPGLLQTAAPEAFPKLSKTMTLSFEKLSLLLLPSVDDFESTFTSLLADDLASEVSADRNSIAVEERRLKFHLHNGWCYVGSPALGYLDKVSPSSASQPPGQGGRNNLVLRGSVELQGMVVHAGVEVVLQLEYVVSWVTRTVPTETKTGRKQTMLPSSRSVVLVVCWGVWRPFPNHKLPEGPASVEGPISIDLKTGLGFSSATVPSSAWQACYESPLRDAGKVNFRAAKPTTTVLENSHQLTQPFSHALTQTEGQFSVLDTTEPDEPDAGDIHESPGVQVSPSKSPSASHGSPKREARRREEGVVREERLKEGGGGREGVRVRQEKAVERPLVEVKSAAITSITSGHYHLVSRSTLAHLHSAGFPELTDLQGHLLPLSPSPPSPPPTTDALDGGPFQIAIQLLACSLNSGGSEGESSPDPDGPCSVLLSYQFSHFPRRTGIRCQLARLAGSDKATLWALQTPDGGKGVMDWYDIDHETLPSVPERSKFTAYLQYGHLWVDVYDGDSLLLLGTAAIPLRVLLSGELQCTVSSAVLFEDHVSDTRRATVAVGQSSGGAAASSCGKLYLRLARRPQTTPPPKKEKQGTCGVLLKQSKGSSQFHGLKRVGGAEEGGEGGRGEEERREEERGDEGGQEESQGGRDDRDESAGTKRGEETGREGSRGQVEEDDDSRRRKLERMQKVRESRARQEHRSPSTSPSSSPLLLTEPFPVHSTIAVQRQQQVQETIHHVLEASISSSHLLRPRLGEAAYVEHQVTNHTPHPLTISIQWSDPHLKLVTDRHECHYLRQLHSITSPMDDDMVTDEGLASSPSLLLHPNEHVRIPFKIQIFQAMGASQNRDIRVTFVTAEGDVLSILLLRVEIQNPQVDRVFHFYQSESTYLRRYFQLPDGGREGETDEDCATGIKFACCSDLEGVCELRRSGDSKHVFVKVPTQSAPLLHSFHVMLYRDEFLAFPHDVWEVFIHPVHRCDHRLVVGQSSTLQLAISGNHGDHRIACHTSKTKTLATKVVTLSPFLLSAHSTAQLTLSLKTLTSGLAHILVSAVDVDSRALLKVWLAQVSAERPSLTRAFQISLPSQDQPPSVKTIAYTNCYSNLKQFYLFTDQPKLLSFTSSTVTLQPLETASIGLQFAPSKKQRTEDILVFINNEDDQIEDCFLVKAFYA